MSLGLTCPASELLWLQDAIGPDGKQGVVFGIASVFTQPQHRGQNPSTRGSVHLTAIALPAVMRPCSLALLGSLDRQLAFPKLSVSARPVVVLTGPCRKWIRDIPLYNDQASLATARAVVPGSSESRGTLLVSPWPTFSRG